MQIAREIVVLALGFLAVLVHDGLPVTQHPTQAIERHRLGVLHQLGLCFTERVRDNLALRRPAS